MSKNIIIQEGGIGKWLTADKLKTNLVGSGTCLWVPEDEVQLTTKTITENGTYNASDDGYYGYEQVIVNIANVGTATGTDGDGDEAVAHTDPGTGELVTDKVPSRIEVINPPTNPYGIYTDGQSISTDGMIVKAYLASGNEYGTVPNAEITLSPNTATYDESADYGSGTAELDGNTVNYLTAIASATDSNGDIIRYTNIYIESGWMLARNIFSNMYIVTGYSLTPTSIVATFHPVNESENNPARITRWGTTNDVFYTNNGTPYYSTGAISFYNINPAITVDNITMDTITTLIDGTRSQSQSGSHQTITVSWPRPLDGKVLDTTFEILVAPPYSTEE